MSQPHDQASTPGRIKSHEVSVPMVLPLPIHRADQLQLIVDPGRDSPCLWFLHVERVNRSKGRRATNRTVHVSFLFNRMD